jgi:hypothetical protein
MSTSLVARKKKKPIRIADIVLKGNWMKSALGLRKYIKGSAQEMGLFRPLFNDALSTKIIYCHITG